MSDKLMLALYLVAVAAVAVVAVLVVADWYSRWRASRPFADVQRTPEVLEFNARLARTRLSEVSKPKHITPRGAA